MGPLVQQSTVLTNNFLIIEVCSSNKCRSCLFIHLVGCLVVSLFTAMQNLEAHPESNPTLDGGAQKYTGIGRLIIAYGIKLSIENGFAGDVVLEAKTTSLARH